MRTLKKHSLTLIIAAVVTFGLSACKMHYKPILNSKTGVNFKEISYLEGLKTAKAENKPLFIFVHATWCPTCKKEEQEILVQQSVGERFNENFINVAIDLDSPDGKALQQQIPIRATPTMFFFQPNGVLEKKIEGFAKAEALLSASTQLSAIR